MTGASIPTFASRGGQAARRAAQDGVAARAVSFLGVPLHALTLRQTEAAIMDAIVRRGRIQHVAMNVAKFVRLRRDAELREDVFGSDIVSVDGMGVLLGARMLGIDVPERVTGVDLMEALLARCAERGWRPYLLGARPAVLEQAVRVLAARHPGLRLAGVRDGYFTPEQEPAVIEQIRAAAPDCLFIGMPTPRKERFMARHRVSLEVPFIMGVGGGIDVLAGHVRRAPQAWQRNGLEWLYRIVQEPRRMWRRYLTTNAAFAGIMVRAVVSRAVGRPGPQVRNRP